MELGDVKPGTHQELAENPWVTGESPLPGSPNVLDSQPDAPAPAPGEPGGHSCSLASSRSLPLSCLLQPGQESTPAVFSWRVRAS